MDDSWKEDINPKRKGAGYVLAQSQDLRCCPEEYARFRNGTRKPQERIITEWASWMKDFRSSHHHLQEAAKDAPKLSRDFVKAVRKEELQRRGKEELLDRGDPQVKRITLPKSLADDTEVALLGERVTTLYRLLLTGDEQYHASSLFCPLAAAVQPCDHAMKRVNCQQANLQRVSVLAIPDINDRQLQNVKQSSYYATKVYELYQVHNLKKRFVNDSVSYLKRISLRRYGYHYIFKAGDSYVGKSNLVLRFTKNEFIVASRARTRVESTAKYIQINEKVIKAQIWDAGAIGVVLVYDIGRRVTFESLGRWLKEARERSDSYHLRAVPTDQATRFAKLNGVSFFETSAFDSTNAEIVFQRLFTGKRH
ncbi:hypothetical protein BGZ68_000258 [Mortierella alpina]|nr:hypothetical protein BGZ68_000258 [Mortierella alpina]